MIRLKDVAERAGVSLMTVSKVLRDAPDISAGTKARIRQLAAEMGYVPDALAQGLRTRTTRLFGLVISAPTNPYSAEMALSLEERAHELGYDLIVAHSLNSPEREESCIRRLLARRVDGIFISPVYRLGPTAPAYEELKRSAIPTVLLGPAAPFCESFTSIETDDLPASINATRHLLELGHRRIAFLAGPPAAPWAQLRCEGYHRALRDAGISDDDRLVYVAGHGIEEGQRATLEMLNEGVRPTAIQAANDLVAIGAAHVLRGQGLRIPEDISVIGFGNIPLSQHLRVPLTTVNQPRFRIGLTAMEAMLDLQRGSKAQSRMLSTDLIIRGSTGAPPAE